jgi:hypothetical protein
MSVRRNRDLGATKAEPRLCRGPKLRNGPTLEDTEEEIEDPKYANEAHDHLEATEVPADDGNTQEKGRNGELYERRCQDVCQLTKIPVLEAISTFLSILSFFLFMSSYPLCSHGILRRQILDMLASPIVNSAQYECRIASIYGLPMYLEPAHLY